MVPLVRGTAVEIHERVLIAHELGHQDLAGGRQRRTADSTGCKHVVTVRGEASAAWVEGTFQRSDS